MLMTSVMHGGSRALLLNTSPVTPREPIVTEENAMEQLATEECLRGWRTPGYVNHG